MKVKKFNESIRDKMVGKDVDPALYDIVTEIEEKIENDEEIVLSDVWKIFEFIKKYTGITDPMELINFFIEKNYITPGQLLSLVIESTYARNS